MDVIEMSIGGACIRIRLDWQGAPKTCRYFCNVITDGELDSAAVFRVLDDHTEQNLSDSTISIVQFGHGDGLNAPRTHIKHEDTRQSGRSHRRWTVSAARYEPGELYASFFVCMRDEPDLDHGGPRHPDGQGFCAFGEVIAGFDVLNLLHGEAGRSELLAPPRRVDAIRVVQDNNSPT